MSIDDAFYLLPILNAGSIFGRLLPNFAVDKTGPLNMFVPSILVASILCFAWMGVKNTAGVVVFSFLYGIASGLILTLPAISIISLSPNLGVVGTRMGMAFAVSSLGMLIGTPIAGAIVKSGWTALQVYSGAVLIFSASFMLAARVWKVGFGFAIKA
jgi:MFS family permease